MTRESYICTRALSWARTAQRAGAKLVVMTPNAERELMRERLSNGALLIDTPSVRGGRRQFLGFPYEVRPGDAMAITFRDADNNIVATMPLYD